MSRFLPGLQVCFEPHYDLRPDQIVGNHPTEIHLFVMGIEIAEEG
ncbi:hypothetical protein J2X24_001557 [Asticcacaulis solisilvae]|nr:hypothetical protein [Asticcacaulis solisilvae]MDR6800039.1 hypothetical protein [Asticcacaulis sp. BE141]